MQSIKYAVISAAGLGSRLGMNIPKCLLEISGRKIIDYQLELLRDIPNIRIVVGFMENEVISYVKSLREDILFVRNPDYNTTTNAYSLYLGSHDIKDPFLSLDGDLLIPKRDFMNFISNCGDNSLIGIGEAKTEDAVFVDFNEKESVLKGFSRIKNQYKYEWTGLAYLSGITIDKDEKYVYNILERYLPLRACRIDSFEIDTANDLVLAQDGFKY